MGNMVNESKSIAIIPARGGSQRVPNKNIIDFLGRPMIAYTIEAAISSGKFDRVIVSTDSKEIAEISVRWGAEVPFLRTEAADSYSSVSTATIFSLKQAETYFKEAYDTVTLLMANCPIRGCEDIKRAFEHFENNGIEAQISCFKFGFMNPWWAFKLDGEGKGRALFPEALKSRSQDLCELYCPSGAIWIAKKHHLFKWNSFYGEHSYFEIDWKSAVDIDNYEDVEMAKAVYRLLNSNS